MQQQASQEQAERAPREEAPTLLEQVPQGEQAPPEEPPVPPVADEGRANDAPPSDGRRTMFVNGEAVRHRRGPALGGHRGGDGGRGDVGNSWTTRLLPRRVPKRRRERPTDEGAGDVPLLCRVAPLREALE